MKVRPIYAIGMLTIVLLLGAIGWLWFSPKSQEPVKIHKVVTPEPRTAETPQPEARAPRTLAESSQLQKSVTLEASRIMRGTTENDPHLKKLRKAMESPEYLEYLKKQKQDKRGFDMRLYMDFMKTQGVYDIGWEEYSDMVFREFFPEGGTPADYEPEMRRQLAEICLEYPERTPSENYTAFRKKADEYDNGMWAHIYFQGSTGERLDWAENIQQNAVSIVAELTPADTVIDTATSPTDSTFTPDASTADVVTENSDTPPPPREGTVSLKELGQIPQSLEELDAEFEKDSFADIPNLPTNADFEKALRERFSPQRFNTAMQTLTQYGSKEGLRRLKESDPEVATHIERLIRPEKDND